ncbi:hypothetical protein Sango_3104000 [Sesamum angolense]|uniref:Reverse transcriptase zinc-binding domain-containing protein n=1 Tax=Sesamum angolense TaxID=2727404 RepID=A0AAE1VZ06_9LAMI|nr:hypothetical protein Sango_3104000 [Sesamum angolense]
MFIRYLCLAGDLILSPLSGLHTNPQKSQLIISKAASGLRDSLLATLGFQEGHLPVRYLGLPLISARLSVADCQPLLQKIDSRIKGWEGVQLSFAGRVQLVKSVLISFEAVIKQNQTSIWVDWIIQNRLRDCSIWTVKDNKGAWVEGKMLSIQHSLVSQIHFFVGNGDSISHWLDPWHPLGPLISRFPREPQLTNTGLLDKLSVVIKDGQWNWPMITDIACLEITYMLPPVSEGPDRISWKSKDGAFNTSTAYKLFHPPGPKVFWSSLMMGPFKIPKNCFILWLAIKGRLSTLDKPWLHHNGGFCILCPDGVPETHDHLLFHAHFLAAALPLSDSRSHYHGPTGNGNMGSNGRHPDGVENMWLTQLINLYWHHLYTTSGRNAIPGAFSNVVDHPRLLAVLLWRR